MVKSALLSCKDLKNRVASLWFGAGFSSPQFGVSLPSSIFPEPARASGRSAREEALKRGFPPSQKNPARPASPRAALPGNGRSQRRKSPPTFTFLVDATEPSPNLARQAPKFGERKRNAAPAPFFPRRLPLSPRSSCRSSLFPCGKCPKSGWGTACCCRRYICSAKGNHMATATASLRRAARELLTTLVVTRSSQRGVQRLRYRARGRGVAGPRALWKPQVEGQREGAAAGRKRAKEMEVGGWGEKFEESITGMF